MSPKSKISIFLPPNSLYIGIIAQIYTPWRKYHEPATYGYGFIDTGWRNYHNLFGGESSIALGVISLLFALGGICGLSMELIKKSDIPTSLPNNKTALPQIMLYCPIVSAVFLGILGAKLLSSDYSLNGIREYGYFTYSASWGFYVECMLIIASAVLCILIANKKIKDQV